MASIMPRPGKMLELQPPLPAAAMIFLAAERSKPGSVRSICFDLPLSGDTPGKREVLEFRRETGAARCADQVTQGQTRWSALLL